MSMDVPAFGDRRVDVIDSSDVVKALKRLG